MNTLALFRYFAYIYIVNSKYYYIIFRVSNSSTFRGWLEATGLDDLMVSTCVCIGLGPDELPPAARDGAGGGGGQVQTGQPGTKK